MAPINRRPCRLSRMRQPCGNKRRLRTLQPTINLMPKLLLCALLLAFTPLVTAQADVDQTKPLDLAVTAVDGSKIDLSKLRGKVVLIDFWATWCPPCREEVPNVVAAYQKYHGQGFEIVGVSLDQDKDAMLA